MHHHIVQSKDSNEGIYTGSNELTPVSPKESPARKKLIHAQVLACECKHEQYCSLLILLMLYAVN